MVDYKKIKTLNMKTKNYKKILAVFVAISVFSLNFSLTSAFIEPINWPHDEDWLGDVLINDVIWKKVTWKTTWNTKDEIVTALNPILWQYCTEDQFLIWYTMTGMVVCTDWDWVDDWVDNCPLHYNPDQLDTDWDWVWDVCDGDPDWDWVPDPADNCPLVSNPWQEDADWDGIWDVCDDDDWDWFFPPNDNCPNDYNPDQLDTDWNGIWDACDDDDDWDWIDDPADNCSLVPNPWQEDMDWDGVWDVCDNCLNTSNSWQEDADNDWIWDVCNDDDWDWVFPPNDNCPNDYNPDQLDTDNDWVWDACDDDDDWDWIDDPVDNCSLVPNPLQEDTDWDLVWDACDNCINDVNANQLDTDWDLIWDACEWWGWWDNPASISPPNLDSTSWSEISVSSWAVIDLDGVQNVTMAIYSSSTIIEANLIERNTDWIFDSLNWDVTYYLTTEAEVFNWDTLNWETIKSAGLAVTTTTWWTDAATNITNAILTSRTDIELSFTAWAVTDNDWVKNVFIILYSDSWLTNEVWRSTVDSNTWTFTWLTPNTTYWVAMDAETYNWATDMWENVELDIEVSTDCSRFEVAKFENGQFMPAWSCDVSWWAKFNQADWNDWVFN